MLNKNIYTYDNYLKLIKDFVVSKKEQGLKYTYQKLSTEIGVQKSYFSKVLAGNADLSPDQFFNFLELTNFEEQERSFAELLLSKSRCGNSKRLKKINSEIKKIKNEKLKTEVALDLPQISDKELHRYYLDPWAQIIHVALTIDRFQSTPTDLQAQLALDEEIFRKTLSLLEELRLIKWEKKKIVVLQNSLHISKTSPYFWAWRNQIIQLSQKQSQSNKDSYNFSVFFSTEPSVKDQIHSEFLEYLKKVEKLVKKSKSKDLYQINFDLVPWS